MDLHGSPSSRLIQTEQLWVDPERQMVRYRFVAPDCFRSPRGLVQGGLIAGFLDEAMGGAVLAMSEGKALPLNLDISLSFLRPVPIGPLLCNGRVLKMGKSVAYLEGELMDEAETVLARATSTAMLTYL